MTVCSIRGELKPTKECTVCENQVCLTCSKKCRFCQKKKICLDCLENQKGSRAFSHPRCKDDKDETDF